MNNIVYPMKVLAVKLEYRRLLLLEMPHGYFRIFRGNRCVVVTYDPDSKRIDSRHYGVYKVSTKRGIKYSEAINSYQKVKAEYDALLNSWHSTYNFDPPRVRFPIKQFFDPHRMNNDFFNNQDDCLGKYISDNPTVSDHGVLKSKNEQIGADLLKQMDIPFKYETSVYLSSIDDTINPDYLVSFYEIDRCAYLELLGMNDRIDYSIRTATKITGFSKEKYRPGREVIYVHVYDKNNFDEDYFVSQVLTAFNNMIPDDVLIWHPESKAV